MSERVEDSIRKILKGFATEAIDAERLDDTKYWTKEISRRICAEGELRNYEAYATGHGGEWVFDVCWVDRDNEVTKSLPLALECEWNSWQEVKDDFEKLLWARAELHVMIFDATFKSAPAGQAQKWAIEKITDLIGRIQTFLRIPPHDDAYLFCVWCHDQGGYSFYFHEGKTHQQGNSTLFPIPNAK